jgi:hypothetical protein
VNCSKTILTHKRQKGAILLSALWVNVLLMLALVGYTPYYLSILQTTSRLFGYKQALALAEAGLAQARWEVQYNGAANLIPTAQNGWDLGGSDCDTLDGTLDGQWFGVFVTACHRLTRTLNAGDGSNDPMGVFTAWVVNLGADLVPIMSRGTSNAQLSQTATLSLRRPATFNYAVFGGTQLLVGREYTTNVDSYDSSLGIYGESNKGSEARVGTNGDGTNAVDFEMSNPLSQVNGTAWLTAGDTTNLWNPSQITGGLFTQPDVSLPRVRIPGSLMGLPIATEADFTILLGEIRSTGQGDFLISNGSSVRCDQPLRVRSIRVHSATLEMTDTCQLFVDATDSDGSWHVPFYDRSRWGNRASFLVTGSGSIVRTGAERMQIFVREGLMGIGGYGLSYDASVPEASRRPQNLQIYITCQDYCRESEQSTLQNTEGLAKNILAQVNPFYGVVYADGTPLEIMRGGTGGPAQDAFYFGAFFSSKFLRNTGFDSATVDVHYDKSLANMVIDGSGEITDFADYQAQAGSWNAYVK